MIEIRRILCPIDFSDYSRRALDHAVAIARWYGSTITVLHVCSTTPVAAYAPGAPTPGVGSIVLTEADRRELLAEMTRFIEAESAPGIPVEAMIREGAAAAEILSQATDLKADLLVMGTHGRSGFERLLLGSITEKVLRKASCPVLTVPRRHPDAVPAAPVLFKEILCAVDFSAPSMQALTYAMSLAQEADARLTVVHVMTSGLDDTPELYDTMISDSRLSLADYRQRHEDSARERLRQAIPEAVGSYCRVETMMIRGKPGPAILRIAGERQTDVIVIGIQGRGAADLMFLGSTTHHVVRAASCPVLTLRQP
ncbi:MAG: universal stress protein [Vicinamibacterales bacterium]|nr:universal stress protein [Vicinamibacterales bacterium]